DPGPERVHGDLERDRDPRQPRLQVAVAEQQQPVGGDRDERDERDRLMQVLEPHRRAGLAADPPREREADPDRERDEDQRDDADGAASEPKDVLAGVGVGARAHAATASSCRLVYGAAVPESGPASSIDPSSRTTRPPAGASSSSPRSGPASSAV